MLFWFGMAVDSGLASCCTSSTEASLSTRFLQRIRTEGGSVSMVATMVGDSQCAFKLTPELARQVSEIGITIAVYCRPSSCTDPRPDAETGVTNAA